MTRVASVPFLVLTVAVATFHTIGGGLVNGPGNFLTVSAFAPPPTTVNRVAASRWMGGQAHDETAAERHEGGDAFTASACSQLDRRSLLVAATAVVASAVVAPSPALALKQKNEALCGTGFFEHIYEYKCTSIGDIEDEGQSKAMSQAQTGLTDGLLGKLGLDDSAVSTEVSYGESTTNKAKKEKPSTGAKTAN